MSHGAALPHQRLAGIEAPRLVMVRAPHGLHVDLDHDGVRDPGETVHAVFFLVSPEEPPGLHLRTLANIASRIDEDTFLEQWRGARSEQELKETLLAHDRYASLTVGRGRAAEWAGRPLREVTFPAGTLVALVRRGGALSVPNGATVLQPGDRLTLIGDAAGIAALHAEPGAGARGND